jgi:hypothetical protein
MYNKNLNKMTQEQLRMQMLAGIITESQYKEKISDRDSIIDTVISTANKWLDDAKTVPGYDDSERLENSITNIAIQLVIDVADEFNLLSDYQTREQVRDIADEIKTSENIDQVKEKMATALRAVRNLENELNEEDSMGKIGNSYPSPKKGPVGTPGNPSLTQYLKDMGDSSEEKYNKIPLDSTTKRYVINRLNEILSDLSEDEIENLKDVGFFEQDFEEELVIEFSDKYDAVDVSPELSKFISDIIYL